MIGWEMVEFHELANLFPMLEEAELSDFAERIAADGYDPAHPIMLHEGKILDGRNRWMACKVLHDEGRLDFPPPFETFSGTSALEFVLRENLHRRHLSEDQRRALAVEIEPLFAAEARQRQREAGGDKIKQAADTPKGPLVANLRQAVQSTEPTELTEDTSGTETTEPTEAVKPAKPAKPAAKASERAAKAVKVRARSVQEMKKLKKEAPDLFEHVRQGSLSLAAAKKELKKRQRPAAKPAPSLPPGTFSLIYADPPWEYRHCADADDAVENHYTTLSTERICALEVYGQPIQQKFAADCILFLWATSPKLAEAMQVIHAWGFDYRTCAIWDKQKIIQGYYFRQQHELLLVAVRGKPGTPEPMNRPPSVFHYPRGQHSQKPEEVRGLIEAMYPHLSKLELFCRQSREGWTVWGNEIDEGARPEAA